MPIVCARGLASFAIAALILSSALVFVDLIHSTRMGSYGLTLLVEPSALSINGKHLSGFVELVLADPQTPIVKTFHITPGKPLKIHINVSRSYIRDWERLWKSFENYAAGKKAVVMGKPLPTVSLIFYLYADNGSEYIGSYTISTASYLVVFRGQPLLKAVRTADRHPFLLFQENPVIEVSSPRIIGLHRVTINTTQWLEGTSLEKEVGEAGTAAQQCQPFTQVWGRELYDAATSPPSGWASRITNTAQACPASLWYLFATRFSKAYYYPATNYTASSAVRAAVAETGVPSGIYTMNDLLHYLAENGAPACVSARWNNVVEEVFKTYDVPVIGARVQYLQEKPIRVGLVFAGFDSSIYTSGMTYSDVIIYPVQHVVGSSIPNGVIKELSIYPSMGNTQGYIMVPTIYYFQGDGIIVQYSVDKVLVNGCLYYRVVPIAVFTPLYIQYLMLYSQAYTVKEPLSSPPPQQVNTLIWSPYSVTVYSNYYSSVEPGQHLYVDTTHGGTTWAEAAGATTNIVETFADTLVSAIFGSLGGQGTLASIFYSLIGDMIGHAEFSAGFSALGVQIVVEATSVSHNVVIQVGRYTLRSAAYSQYMPLLGCYVISVGTYTPPPGAESRQSGTG